MNEYKTWLTHFRTAMEKGDIDIELETEGSEIEVTLRVKNPDANPFYKGVTISASTYLPTPTLSYDKY